MDHSHMNTDSWAQVGSLYPSDTIPNDPYALAGEHHFQVKEIEVLSVIL
jgi:hypothetical protein